MIKVLFFARLAELAHTDSYNADYRDAMTVRVLLDDMDGKLPQALIDYLKYDVSMISINKVMADWDDSLEDSDEIAFLPPFSGG
jgi:molybdopterin converting factor small subunit